MRSRPNLVHGHTVKARPSSEYLAWLGMRARCNRRSHRSFVFYGARGISVCDAWSGDFQAFLRDMGPKPSPRHTLERIDNNGHYSPENCRWATPAEQARNRRNSSLLTLRGRTQPMVDWATESGVPRTTIRERLNRGWALERAVFEMPPTQATPWVGDCMTPKPGDVIQPAGKVSHRYVSHATAERIVYLIPAANGGWWKRECSKVTWDRWCRKYKVP